MAREAMGTLAAVPGRHEIEGARADGETRETLSCLARHGADASWGARPVERGADGTFWLTVVWLGGGRPLPVQVSALALALENQLIASVTRVRIGVRDPRGPLVLVRGPQGRDRPATTTSRLAAVSHVSPARLPTSAGVSRLVLRCSAVAL